MGLSSNLYDIAFIGHMCLDEIHPYLGETHVALGSAVLCGALAAARIGKRVAIITKMAVKDEPLLKPLQQNGVDVHVIPSAETTRMKVIHTSADVDERQMFQLKNAGLFSTADLPPLAARSVHLAGITDQEFDLKFIDDLRAKGYSLSADMQSFVRQVQPDHHNIAFQDVPNKKEIARRLNMVKLDAVEARILTDTDDIVQAARTIEAWGCPEVIVTQAGGVLAQVKDESHYEKFSNKSDVGRTGRGDTTFGAYLARRLDHNPVESLKFAAALVSIKMETRGPFNGNLVDVLARMQ